MYQESVYHCYLLQNRTVKTAWPLEEVEALQEAMGPLEALIFQHSLVLPAPQYTALSKQPQLWTPFLAQD